MSDRLPPVTSGATHVLRPIDRASASERAWVALGMHLTLIEVEGERGRREYPLSFMRQRLDELLDPGRHVSEIVLAVEAGSSPPVIAGHTILRLDRDRAGRRYGLVSTTFVHPGARRVGLADRLLSEGEGWVRTQGLAEIATWTSSTNIPLIRLYEKHGYRTNDSGMNGATLMVRLAKTLD